MIFRIFKDTDERVRFLTKLRSLISELFYFCKSASLKNFENSEEFSTISQFRVISKEVRRFNEFGR